MVQLQCSQSSCSKPTHNGLPGYCSDACRDAAAAESRNWASCSLPGCSQVSDNGAPGFCSKVCRDAAAAATVVSALAPAICGFDGCNKPTYNGALGFCTKEHRDADASMTIGPSPKRHRGAIAVGGGVVAPIARGVQQPERPTPLPRPLPKPMPSAIVFQDPRRTQAVGVIAFYFAGQPEAWDTLCCAGFLGNFWDLGQGGLKLRGRKFTNSEAAFQALKWWGQAGQFENLSGHAAFQLKKKLAGKEDWTYAGLGSNWAGMLAVLHEKFAPGSYYADGLMQTEDAFLLEHNNTAGRDKVWSDNLLGDGTNWLGLQLMMIRDDLFHRDKSDTSTWTWFAQNSCSLDLHTGKPRTPAGAAKWQNVVSDAAKAVSANVGGGSSGVACARHGCGKPSWNGRPGEYCSKKCRNQ